MARKWKSGKDQLLEALRRIEELNFVLENWMQDDRREASEYPLDELVALAADRLAEFAEDGHMLNDMLLGLDGPEEKRYAVSQRRRIRAWLEKARVQLAADRLSPAS